MSAQFFPHREGTKLSKLINKDTNIYIDLFMGWDRETESQAFMVLLKKFNTNQTFFYKQQVPPLGGAWWSCFSFVMFLFTTFEPSSNRLGTSIICSTTIAKISQLKSSPKKKIAWRFWFITTFSARSSKHCSTFSLVFALHSRNNAPSSLARAIPSSLLTALSDS